MHSWKQLTHEQLAEAGRMFDAGLPVQEIADFFQRTRQGMWVCLKKMGKKIKRTPRVGEKCPFYSGIGSVDHRAQHVVSRAVRLGILTPKPCEVCGFSGNMSDGRRGVQAHHDDYDKPLDVRWLCKKHHHEWHRNNIAKNRSVKQPKSVSSTKEK